MESLIKELEAYKKNLSAEEKVNLSDAVLDKLYAVYPFNKFEYTISHLKIQQIKEQLSKFYDRIYFKKQILISL